MAAITFKFGVQSDVNALESQLGAEPTPEEASLRGLGSTGTDDAALAQSHAQIVSMAYLRRACEEVLQGRSISVSFEGRNVWLNLDQPLPQEPSWNPPTQVGLRRFKLLSWTSKMGTPSFSLPAGAPTMGGTCPGASGGQTIVPLTIRKKQMAEVERLTGRPVDPARAICQHCYAEGGQYSTGQVQYAQIIRYAWTEQAVRDGTFAQVMSWAIKNADYALEGKGKTKLVDDNDAEVFLPNRGERDGRKYFRLHDSGDFWSPEYVAAWKAVADDNLDVTFWAPSRCWAVSGMCLAINEINNPPRNFVIRPSAYSINEPCPRDLGPGWAAGSTVYADAHKPAMGARLPEDAPYQWDCQAYQTDNDKVTCRDAMPPGGTSDADRGCRACWKYGFIDENGQEPGLIIDYTLH